MALVGALVWVSGVPADTVTASSFHDPRYQPEYALDGDPASRWASLAGAPQPQWLQVDLGRVAPIDRVVVRWEAAYAAGYEIQASDDGEHWTCLRKCEGSRDGDARLDGLGGHGRFLRIFCDRPGPFPLYSIWEVTSPDPELAGLLREAYAHMAEARAAREASARQRIAERLSALRTSPLLFSVRKPGVDGHWYANFGYYAADANAKLYRTGSSRLVRLDLASGTTTDLFADPLGSIRDAQVSFDGTRIVFSYLRGGTDHYHLYDMAADGSGLRQLTDGDCDDIEPTFTPGGWLVFISSRCNRWVNCWLTPVASLYRCDADGGSIRPVSGNIEHDNTPWPLADGRLAYTRWEYVDRSQVDFHHLWAMNPDGTEQTVLFGNQNPGTLMIDAKPIPGTERIVAVFSPGHGIQDHQGYVTVVDPARGPDDLGSARSIVTPAPDQRDPYPLAPDLFLVAVGPEIRALDADGVSVTVYRLPDEQIAEGLWVNEPIPLAAHEKPPALPDRTNPSRPTGRLLLSDVCTGRNMVGVRRGEIRKLLVLETLPKPINYTGGMDPLTYGGTFSLERIVGTVPVEEDGSAYMELPALRSFFFVALDENDNSVKRMQSFLTVEPGEVTSCVGCHEQRSRTGLAGAQPLAARRAPSTPEPVAGVPEVLDFPRDIQPVLDRNCVSCHDYTTERAGGLVMSGDRGPMFSHSYYTLSVRQSIADGRNEPRGNRAPRTIGAAASPLMAMLLGSHHGPPAAPEDVRMVRYWIESGAPYPGTYGALGSGSIGGYYANQQVETDVAEPTTQAASAAIIRRCASCHTGGRGLPRTLSDECDVSFWRPEWGDPRLRLSRHIVFNLTRPELSLVLLAPLAKEAGGYGRCVTPGGAPVFADQGDPDYKAILSMCAWGKSRLETMKRFDMPGFRPPEPYLREMAKYGVISAIPPPGDPVDTYALDRAYWASLWFQPR